MTGMPASDSSIQVPAKRPGSAYTIVLEEQTNPGMDRERVPYSKRAPSSFPEPEFADECICCNRPADGNRHRYSPWMGTGYANHSIELPLCRECTSHAFGHLDPQGFALLPMVPGLIAMGIGWFRDNPTLLVIGACLSAVTLLLFTALWLHKSYRKRVVHHEGIDIDVKPGRVRIATNNPELVRSVVALNPQLVQRVR